MSREEILKQYTVKDGRITNPGKFEGQPIFVPLLWNMALDGFADRDTGRAYVFNVPKDDPWRKEWPELDQWLGRKRTIRVVQTDQGFVSATR